MTQLSGRRALVTGASGLVAFPVAMALAKTNDVYALARFSNPGQKRLLEAAGARTISFDLALPRLRSLRPGQYGLAMLIRASPRNRRCDE